MKDKEKQIEEMARDIYEQKSCDTSFEENCKLLAYDLITLGWIKPNEDSVVLSKEEAERFRGQTINLKKVKSQASKETAEKIYSMIRNKGMLHTEYDWCDYLEIEMDDLKEIAKQFGLDIKE